MTTEIGAVLVAALIVVGPPLSLLLMCLALRLLGVPGHVIRERALRFADRWIQQRGSNSFAEVAKAMGGRKSEGGEAPES